MNFRSFPQTVRILSVMDIRRKKKYKGYTDARNFHSLSFRVKGNAEFVCDGETILAKEKSLLLIPEGISYGTKTGSEHLFVVHFKTDESFKADKISSFIPETPAIYESLFQKMYNDWKSKKTGYYFAVLSGFYTIIENIQKDISQQNFHNNADRMHKTKEFIHTHFSDPTLSVGTLAELFGTSETYFRREFKRIYGTTPLKYINNLRIEYALELLKSGYYSVSQVSEKSGFPDAKYFARIIKNHAGVSPSKLIK